MSAKVSICFEQLHIVVRVIIEKLKSVSHFLDCQVLAQNADRPDIPPPIMAILLGSIWVMLIEGSVWTHPVHLSLYLYRLQFGMDGAAKVIPEPGPMRSEQIEKFRHS